MTDTTGTNLRHTNGGFATGAGRKPRGAYNKDKLVKDTLRKLVAADGKKAGAIERILIKVIEMAEEGNLDAANLLFNRAEGYPVRPVANEGDVPMFLNVTWLKEPPVEPITIEPIKQIEGERSEPPEGRSFSRSEDLG